MPYLLKQRILGFGRFICGHTFFVVNQVAILKRKALKLRRTCPPPHIRLNLKIVNTCPGIGREQIGRAHV